MPPRYTESQAREAVAASLSYAETLRRLGMCDRGGSWKILEKWLAIWDIPTDHFDAGEARRRWSLRNARRTPIEQLLVAGSSIGSSHLKERLYSEGLKDRICELCGQDEAWYGRPLSLILDHVNGVRTDNRLENLRIVCPNCNATLDTHCGRNARAPDRLCDGCDELFHPKRAAQRYCSAACANRARQAGVPRPATRKVERPPYAQLAREVAELGWSATGRRYGVSDKAVRKWMRFYAAQEAA